MLTAKVARDKPAAALAAYIGLVVANLQHQLTDKSARTVLLGWDHHQHTSREARKLLLVPAMVGWL